MRGVCVGFCACVVLMLVSVPVIRILPSSLATQSRRVQAGSGSAGRDVPQQESLLVSGAGVVQHGTPIKQAADLQVVLLLRGKCQGSNVYTQHRAD